MALKKKITESNGITVSYHKISKIELSINQQVSILVESYLDESFRLIEKEYAKGVSEGEPVFPYIHAEYITIPYNEEMELFGGNITKKAYDLLKTQEKYKGAEDVLENG